MKKCENNHIRLLIQLGIGDELVELLHTQCCVYSDYFSKKFRSYASMYIYGYADFIHIIVLPLPKLLYLFIGSKISLVKKI